MTKSINTLIIKHIEDGKTIEDVVSLLTMLHGDMFETKTSAREHVTALLEEKNIETKRVSKSGQLKDWFLSQEDPTSVDGKTIKEQCELLEMKGGSVQYYVNAYKLAIDLVSQVANK